MSTASGLVFTGDNDGFFYAFDAATGKELWKFQTGAPVWGSAPSPTCWTAGSGCSPPPA